MIACNKLRGLATIAAVLLVMPPDALEARTRKGDKLLKLGQLAEARKEFYGENQLFYMYKRLNHAVVVSSTQNILPSSSIFVFPKPQDELTYRTN